jgi:hypothetical protein
MTTHINAEKSMTQIEHDKTLDIQAAARDGDTDALSKSIIKSIGRAQAGVSGWPDLVLSQSFSE